MRAARPVVDRGAVVVQERRETVVDPGSRRAGVVAAIVSTLMVLLVLVQNQWAVVMGSGTPPAPTVSGVQPPDGGQFELTSRIMLKVAKAFADLESKQLGGSAEAQGVPTSTNGAQFVNELNTLALTDADQFRLAILETELLGRDAAEARLHNLWPGDDMGIAQPNPALEEDVATYRQILESGPDSIPAERAEAFKTNHGYFARVAMSYGKPEASAERAAVFEGGGVLLATLIGACGTIALLGLAGMTCFVIALVRMTSGAVTWRFQRPLPGGSVGLEMLAIFVTSFVLLKYVSAAVEAIVTPAGGTPPEWMTAAHLGMQWSLILVLLYPLLRGVSFARLSSVVGWTRGRGVFREIFAGLFGYLAGLPLLFGAFVITVVLMFVIQIVRRSLGLPDEQVSNPILELVNSANPLAVLLLVTLATIWAPIVEETIMRGALYRHLRGKLGILLAGAISAIVFGVLHGYAFYMLMPVMTLGFVFAMIREWRGSLVACVTAHAVHNGMIMALLLVVMSVLKG